MGRDAPEHVAVRCVGVAAKSRHEVGPGVLPVPKGLVIIDDSLRLALWGGCALLPPPLCAILRRLETLAGRCMHYSRIQGC